MRIHAQINIREAMPNRAALQNKLTRLPLLVLHFLVLAMLKSIALGWKKRSFLSPNLPFA